MTGRSLRRAVPWFLLMIPMTSFAQDDLDAMFGIASMPAYIKHYEADRSGKVLINPYLQVATPDFPAILVPGKMIYKWVIDLEGRLAIIQEVPHPLGRTYQRGFFRPEDKSRREPGYQESYGHVSAVSGGPARISGEILYDEEHNLFSINNKSGRYSRFNPDRTPAQLAAAARLIHRLVDPGTATWGPVFYLLDYAPDSLKEQLLASPDLAFDDPEKKTHPHLLLPPSR